ncbi:MAG: MFS transporter [Sphingomonadales bacterium]|nr:MFS transporter [Sphingomonadales bacterium]
MAAPFSVTDAARQRPSNPWLVLALLLVIYIFNFADRYLLTGLIGPIKAEFQLGDGFMGLLMGPAFVVLYVLSGVPIARLADRSSRVRIIAAGCVMWSVATLATGFATGPVSLALARVGVGVGEAAFVAPAYSLLTDMFRPERRGLAFAILGVATYAGQIVGQGGGPALAEAYGWRNAFFMMGAPGLVLGALLLLTVKEPQRAVVVDRSNQIPFMAMVHELRRSPSFLLMMLSFGLGSLSGVAFGYWGPELFTRAYGIDPVTAKAAFAINFGAAGLFGMIGFGALADRAARRGMAGPVRMSGFALFAATACILAATWAPSLTVAKWLAIPSGLLGGGWAIGFFATLQAMLPERYRAAATALFIAVTTLLGYFIGPSLAGGISDALGNSAESLRIGLSVTIPTGFVAALLGWLAASRVTADKVRLAGA